MRWEKKSEAMKMGSGPGKRWGHTCNAIRGGKLLYVFGGYGQNNCQTNQVHVFDTDSQTWSEPPIKGIPPIPRDSHTCTEVGDKLFVFGGTDGLNPLKDLHILDTSSNTWVSPSVTGHVPEAREGHSAAIVGKRLFIFGGCGKSMNNSEVYYNDLYILDTETFVWERAFTYGTPPAARDSHSCSSWRNKIVVIGGEDQHDYYLSDVHILDTDALFWKKLKTTGKKLPPRAGHSMVAFGKYIFVFGGFTDAQNLYNDLYLLDMDTGMWINLIPSGEGPSARFSMSGDCLDPSKGGVMVFIGGCNKSLEALDDMFYLYTGLLRDDGREVRRMEKLSMRKQLKLKCQEPYQKMLKCQEQHVQVPSLPYQSGQNQQQQYFPLNMYRPTTGKRAFQAKVTKNIANGYTIETFIDGKPMRGVIFSTSLKTNPNPDKKDAENAEPKSTSDQDPATRFPTPHGSHPEAASASSMKDTGHPAAGGQSHEVVIRIPHDVIGSSSNSEANKTYGTGTSTMDYHTTLENPLAMVQGLGVFPTLKIPPAIAQGSCSLPIPPAMAQGSCDLPTSENPPANAMAQGSSDLPNSDNPPAMTQGSGALPNLENPPPATAQGSGALPNLENPPPAMAQGSGALPNLENPPPAMAQGSGALPNLENPPPAMAQGSGALPNLENPPPAMAQGSGALPILENTPGSAMAQGSSPLPNLENLPPMAQGSGALPNLENPPPAMAQGSGALPILENPPSNAMAQGSSALPILENPPAMAQGQGSGASPTNQDDMVAAADRT